MTLRTPIKGNVVMLDFNPQAGHEQAGRRPGLIVSPKKFNELTGFALVCPITNQKKGYPFEVDVEGTKKTTGVILADQIKSLDWKKRNAKVVDSVSLDCLNKTKELIQVIIDADD